MRDHAVMLAHVVAPSEVARSWTFHPALAAGLVLAGVAYGRGSARLRRRVGRPHGRRRAVNFYAGLGVLAAALMSPLDAVASALFSAHMVQHLVLMLVAAPLLAYARPTVALVAGLPARGREAVHHAAPVLRPVMHALTRPVVVWASGALVLWAWHVPSLYQAALAHDALHVAEHASFVGAALLFWSVVFSSGARRGAPRPVAALLVLATSVQGSALGAILLLVSTPLYPMHAAGAAVWGTSPVDDQRVAGGLMWGPPGFMYVVVLGWLVVKWFEEMDERNPEATLVTTGAGP